MRYLIFCVCIDMYILVKNMGWGVGGGGSNLNGLFLFLEDYNYCLLSFLGKETRLKRSRRNIK